jgi:ABC-type antimicrobial peptide transport system permease subunit
VTIVGVVATAKYGAIREEPQITIYALTTQRPGTGLTLHARVSGDAGRAVGALARVAREIDPVVPVVAASTLGDQIDSGLSTERALTVLGTLFAGTALVVAGAGLYGLIAYTISQRIREIGIRRAVGATRRHILSLFLSRIGISVAVGTTVGIPLALLTGRSIEAVLYGVAPTSVAVLAPAIVILGLASFAGASIPAWRAATVSPVVALREP